MSTIIQKSEPYHEITGTSPFKSVRDAKEIAEGYSVYLCDESKITGGKADAVAFAFSEKQVVEVMKEAGQSDMPVTISAARTGIVGGAVPLGGTLLSLEKMNRFLGVRWDEEKNGWCVRVEPALSLDDLKELLEKKDFQEPLSRLEGEARDALEKFSEESDQWFYPMDPTEKSAHLGGTVATNASGGRSFKYGQTRNYVTGLRVVLADGTLLFIKRGEVIDSDQTGFSIEGESGTIQIPYPDYQMVEVKNAAGFYNGQPMDLIDYFIGSEGTLGVITEMELLLERKPEMKLGVVAYFPSEDDAVHFVQKARKKRDDPDSCVDPTALEYFDRHSLDLLRKKREQDGTSSAIPPFADTALAAIYFEQDGKEADVDDFFEAYEELLNACNTSMDDTWGAMDDKELAQMTTFRHMLPEAVNSLIGQRQKDHPGLHKVGTDFAVPDDSLEKIIEIYKNLLNEQGFEYVIFGHIGENHLHVNILPKDEAEVKKAKDLYLTFAKHVVNLGGTVSGEHGIGKIKKAMLKVLYSPGEIDEMKKVKQVLDPKMILGRGNLF